jgi:hypothetical protein
VKCIQKGNKLYLSVNGYEGECLVCLSLCLSVSLSVCLSVSVCVCVFVSVHVCPFVCLFVRVCLCLCVCVCLSVFMCVCHLSLCLSVRMCVRLTLSALLFSSKKGRHLNIYTEIRYNFSSQFLRHLISNPI